MTSNFTISDNNSKLREECGIVAIFSKKGTNVDKALYRALLALQHRGQDSAGIATYNGKEILVKKGIGLVTDIFEKDFSLPGHFGIGHTRYPTTGRCEIDDVPPMLYKNVCVSHNGHFANYSELKEMLTKKGYYFLGTVDSEIVVFMLNDKLNLGIEKAVEYCMNEIDGSYSDAVIVNDKLVIFRDPLAIRPLVWGENEDYICFCSESVALDINKIPYKGTLCAGELAIISNKGIERKIIKQKGCAHCMFEYVYFSRPDSIINDKLVLQVRKYLGKELAKEYPVHADLVMPVPDTARTAAEQFAKELNIHFEEGLIKNRYVGRTFIMPDQKERALAVRLKLNPVKSVIENKRVVLVDDSIVRATTLREIVAAVKEAGAKEVHVRITCPPVKAPCFYGVNIPTYSELIANKKSVAEIKDFLGADSLGYLSNDGLRRAIELPICDGCLTENYPTECARKNSLEKKHIDRKSY